MLKIISAKNILIKELYGYFFVQIAGNNFFICIHSS